MTSWKYYRSIPKKQLRRFGYLIKYFFRNRIEANAIIALKEQQTKIIGIHNGPNYSDEIGFWLNVTSNTVVRIFQISAEERTNQIKRILYRNYDHWNSMSIEQQKYEEDLIESDIYALMSSYIKEVDNFGVEEIQTNVPRQKSYSYTKILMAFLTVLVAVLTVLYMGYDFGKNEDLEQEIQSLELKLKAQENLINDQKKNNVLQDSIKVLNDSIQ